MSKWRKRPSLETRTVDGLGRSFPEKKGRLVPYRKRWLGCYHTERGYMLYLLLAGKYAGWGGDMRGPNEQHG